jgi:hypothetical protein
LFLRTEIKLHGVTCARDRRGGVLSSWCRLHPCPSPTNTIPKHISSRIRARTTVFLSSASMVTFLNYPRSLLRVNLRIRQRAAICARLASDHFSFLDKIFYSLVPLGSPPRRNLRRPSKPGEPRLAANVFCVNNRVDYFAEIKVEVARWWPGRTLSIYKEARHVTSEKSLGMDHLSREHG